MNECKPLNGGEEVEETEGIKTVVVDEALSKEQRAAAEANKSKFNLAPGGDPWTAPYMPEGTSEQPEHQEHHVAAVKETNQKAHRNKAHQKAHRKSSEHAPAGASLRTSTRGG